MSNYYLMALPTDDNDYLWCVMETRTDQLVKAFTFEDEAEEYCEFLENGGAFDGFTPSFILREVVLSKDLNSEFSNYISA